jgi:putative spermidine/putrescine transport system permease protein
VTAVLEPARTSAPAPRKARRERHWITASAAWLAVVLAIGPVVVTLLAAFTANWNAGPLGEGVTTRWMSESMPEFLTGLATSVRVALIALVVDLAVGLPLAWTFARTKLPGLSVLRWLTGLPLAVPGIAVGLALVAMYPQLQASGVLLIAGHVVVTLPFLIAAVAPVLADDTLVDLESTAATLGARFARRFATVTLPHIRTSLLSAALMIFTLSFGEFNLTYFIVNPAEPTLPVALFGAFIYGQTSNAAALTLWYCAVVVPIAVALQLLGKIAVKRSK